MNKTEPLLKCRKLLNRHQNQGVRVFLGLVRKETAYCPTGDRHEGGMNLAWASEWNVGTSDFDAKGEIQVVNP